jgi:hypothetical protein
MPDHEPLGEILGRFQLRSRPRRPEDGQAAPAERVHDAIRERTLGTDDGEVELLPLGEQRERVDGGQGKVAQAAFQRRPGVARGHVHRHAGRLREPPCHGVLASAAADDQAFSRTGRDRAG